MNNNDKQICRGGWLGALGLERKHYFSHDYGGTDKCWRRGCDASWGSIHGSV